MHGFIKEVINKIIISNVTDISKVIIILPNKRSRIFLKQEISKIAKKTIFSPLIYDIEEFMSLVSGINKISDTELLFEFYNIYLNQTKKNDQQTFEEFISWAKTLLRDFSEIDRELCNTDSLFDYLNAFKDLTHWSNYEEETDLIKNYKEFWGKIKLYHNDLKAKLLNIGMGYQGLIYREACEQILSYTENRKSIKHIFIGFNALSKSESEVIQEIVNSNGEIYWDIDNALINSDYNNASLFIESYLKEWPYYKKNNIEIASNEYKKEKNIQAIGTPKNIGQVKYVGELLHSMGKDELNNTAVVLGDEKLLIPLLNSIPSNVKNINVTMGYPLKNSNIYSFFYLLINIHTKNQNSFYYKSIISLVSHELISPILNNGLDLREKIRQGNLIYMSKKNIIDIDNENHLIYELLFSKWTNAVDGISSCLKLINLIKKYYSENPENDFINLELLYHINKIFLQINNSCEKLDYLKNINSLKIIFKELCEMNTSPFSGEPVKGLQIMGMLETRLLNYKNIIVTSLNEGILPVGNNNSSFIPFEIKKANELQTFKEKDSVFAYHFYRLIKRAQNIWLIYNTEPDAMNNGEQSRFITQIEVEGIHSVNKNILISKTPVKKSEEPYYSKTKLVQEKLNSIIENGISASMLCLYAMDQIKFFETYVLGLRKESIEETIASSTIGNIVHDSLEIIYKGYVGKRLNVEDIEKMNKLVSTTVKDVIKNYVREENMNKGKNVIIIETVKKYVERVIKIDRKVVENKNDLRIIAVEKEFETKIKAKSKEYKIRGKIDRIDQINGELRVIDYKSGKKLNKRDITIKENGEITKEKGIYNLQLLIYILGIEKEFEGKRIKSGIINLKNISDGVLEGIFKGEISLGRNELKNYKVVIIDFITKILDKNLMFKN
ncbi:MAG: PD-(D/E)XK nuclease family protein [Flavobacteriaceae bacterium]